MPSENVNPDVSLLASISESLNSDYTSQQSSEPPEQSPFG